MQLPLAHARPAEGLPLRSTPALLRSADEFGLRVVGARKQFGSVQALCGVDLAVRPGEIHALLGRNGAGKTTLIRILSSSVVPDAGRVWVDGIDVLADARKARGRVGLVLGEDRSFFWRLSGQQNLEFFGIMHGLSRKESRQAAEDALAAVHLSEVGVRRVDRYSTGMRSRLGIARALLGSPAVLLLDEPTRSLDPAAAFEVRELVRYHAAQRGVAVLLATHDLQEAADLSSRTLILDSGRVVTTHEGPVDATTLEDSFR